MTVSVHDFVSVESHSFYFTRIFTLFNFISIGKSYEIHKYAISIYHNFKYLK
jgi:hypothetical protein